TYSPTRVRYPYVRGTLLSMFREARGRLGDPVLAWAEIVQDPEKTKRYKSGRGKGGLVRSTWAEDVEVIAAAHVYTIKRWGPARARQGRAGASPRRRGRGAARRGARVHPPALGPGPDRRLLPAPGDVDGQLRLRCPLQRAHRRPDAQLLRLVRRPAGGFSAGV